MWATGFGGEGVDYDGAPAGSNEGRGLSCGVVGGGEVVEEETCDGIGVYGCGECAADGEEVGGYEEGVDGGVGG